MSGLLIIVVMDIVHVLTLHRQPIALLTGLISYATFAAFLMVVFLLLRTVLFG